MLMITHQEKDRDHFSQFVTEDFEAYILRKRCLGVYANNPEIQALSEMLARPIEVYSYSAGTLIAPSPQGCLLPALTSHTEPMNTFQGAFGAGARPIRISYHRYALNPPLEWIGTWLTGERSQGQSLQLAPIA